MKTYIHGTSYESAMNILSNGFQESQHIWDCSVNGLMYFRDANAEDAEYITIGNGQIAAAYTDSKETRIAIIELTVSDELSNEIFETDTSCNNTCDCYQITIKNLQNFIKSGDIIAKIKIYGRAYMPYLRALYLQDINKDYMTINNKLLLDAINVLNRNKIYVEDIYNYGNIEKEYHI